MYIYADIDSLYTSVPVDQAINNILNLISEHDIDTFSLTQDDIRHLLLLALRDNYFKFNDVYYMQRNCLAMGNRLAVVASNCFVYELEQKLFTDLPNQPLLLVCYIDDIIAVFDQSTISKELISTKLNCLHSDIKFTHSITTLQEGAMFLGTYVCTIYSQLSLGMYRKPTHTNTVLNFKSHHPFSTKLGIAIGQFKRVKNICNS